MVMQGFKALLERSSSKLVGTEYLETKGSKTPVST